VQIEITKDVVTKLLSVVDAGLSSGMGNPTPGQMCVEAAVCYALGLPHGDDPQCVAPTLRSLKIRLNDSNWSSKAARAKGLRRLAVIQLGSKGHLNGPEFAKRLADLACRTSVPIALRAAASIHKDPKHKAALLEAANRCETSPNREAAEYAREIARSASASADASADASASASASADAYAYASASASAYAYAYASADASASASADASADADARDKILSDFAEGVVQILVEMKVPGVQWLELTEVIAA
jgi:hypothetical protein